MGMDVYAYFAYGIELNNVTLKIDSEYSIEEEFENLELGEISLGKIGYYDSEHYVLYINNTCRDTEWEAVKIDIAEPTDDQLYELDKALNLLEEKFEFETLQEGYYMWPYYSY